MYLIVDVVMLSKIASPAKLITSITAELVHCHVLRNYCWAHHKLQQDEVEGLLADTSILPWHCAIARNPSHNSLANLVASGSSSNLAAQAAAAAAADSASNSTDNSPIVTGRRGSIKLATPRGKRPGMHVTTAVYMLLHIHQVVHMDF
jgi:hypothetical protein